MAGNTKSVVVFVIDASFLISIIFPDEKVSSENSDYIKDFRTDKITFQSCELLKYEIYNCLKSAILQKRITKERVAIIEKAFKLMKIEYKTIDFSKTFELALKYNLTFYYASYLYLAKINKRKLLTLDKKLAEITK